MNDVFPGSQTYGSSSHHQLMNEFTFGCGGPSSNSNPNSNSSLGMIGGAGRFLFLESSQLRRSKSDSGRPSHHRQSCSEDIRSRWIIIRFWASSFTERRGSSCVSDLETWAGGSYWILHSCRFGVIDFGCNQQQGDTSGFGNEAGWAYGIEVDGELVAGGVVGGGLGVGDGGIGGVGGGGQVMVSKPNVTNGQTANASHKRQK